MGEPATVAVQEHAYFPDSPTATRPNTIVAAHFQYLGNPKKIAFLSHFSESGLIAQSALKAGIVPNTHRNWFEWKGDNGELTPECVAYREAFELAQELAKDRLEAEAQRRAVEGFDETIFNGAGEVIRRKHTYSDALLVALLKAERPDKYGDRTRLEVSGSATIEHLITSAWAGATPALPNIAEGQARAVTQGGTQALPAPAPASADGTQSAPGLEGAGGERAGEKSGGAGDPPPNPASVPRKQS